MDGDDITLQTKLDEIMPWIGLYITLASAVCTLAIAADAFNGFRLRKFWFPCKYFSLNALSLTLLAVAMKLPMDLNTNMSDNNAIAKLASSFFMSTAMSNFMSSLGSMNDQELLENVVALGVLVITILANLLIQLYLVPSFIHIFTTTSSLLMLPTLVALAITVPAIKRDLESKYHEKHKLALKAEEAVQRREAFGVDKQREEMLKYWVMAETSSPQFVMARSAVCTTSTLTPLLSALLISSIIIMMIVADIKWIFGPTSSEYKE